VIPVGKYNTLKILRETSVGLFLGDDEGEDVLLPNKYVPESYEIGDEIEVYVYRDNDQRKIATNLTPKIQLFGFALLQVFEVNDVGAFMDWGLEKGLMVPYSEQRQKLEAGRWYIVYMDLDEETDRIFATNKLDKHLQNVLLSVEEGDQVDLLVLKETELGYNVIVNSQHKGLVYHNEVFSKLNVGDNLTGYVKTIREENKLDISLQPLGYENAIVLDTDKVYQQLTENNGFLAFTDKSSPDEISRQFEMSKKAFKKAIGALYKSKKIEISPTGITLVDAESKEG
jgi:uncharacterized protein